MYGYSDHMDGGGNGGWVVMLILLVILILLVAAGVWFATGGPRRGLGEAPMQPPRSSAADLLAERLARGEIDPDEYRARMAALNEHKTAT
jgi:putative membrane protein